MMIYRISGTGPWLWHLSLPIPNNITILGKRNKGAFSAHRCATRLYHREARPLASLGQHVQIQSDMPPQNSRHLPVTEWCGLFSGCQVVDLMGWSWVFLTGLSKPKNSHLGDHAKFPPEESHGKMPKPHLAEGWKFGGKFTTENPENGHVQLFLILGPTQLKENIQAIQLHLQCEAWIDKNGAVPKLVRM